MSEPSHTENKTVGAPYDALILAGGKGSRLEGRDKGWVMHKGLPLIEHTLACLAAQTPTPSRILISANRNIDAYKQTGQTVVTDERANFAGPLAGVEAGLMRCKKNNMLVIPCDTPLLPADLFARLEQALAEKSTALAAYAVTSDGPQPLCCLLRPSAVAWLTKYLDEQKASAIKWLEQLGACAVHFEDVAAFSNFNTMEMFQSLKSKGQA
ncbi:MAG: molybdenum cofactor guanylyltransferase [Alcaligenaceae bacterium]|nr:MAG: molybdenum cofactor guanylyltransferase [Alcaligenaceae bacterium]